MTRRALASALALTLLTGVVIASSSTPSYTLTDLGPGTPSAISAAGSVVGSKPDANGNPRAFLWTPATGHTDLGIADSYAAGVNADGVVVGTMTSSTGVQHAFRWKAGVTTDLGTLPGFTESWAAAVNASGQIVGGCSDDFGTTRAFLWQSGTMTDLGTLGGSWSAANAINDSGTVVGSSLLDDETTERAFVWDAANGMFDLGAAAGNDASIAMGVNDAGQAVGWSYPLYWEWDPEFGWYATAGVVTATVWQDGVASALAGSATWAYGVNDATAAHGVQVVGLVDGECGLAPFVWEIDGGGQVTGRELDESLNAAFAGQLDSYPAAINDAGQIALSGLSSSSEQRALLLSPSSLPPVQQAIHAPTYVAATAGAQRVTLSWSTVCGADSYVVQRGTAAGGPYQTIASGLTATQYVDTSAPLGGTYHYVVAAVKGTMAGLTSPEAVAAPLPYAPTGLAATALTGKSKGQVSLKWTASASGNIAHYKVYRSTSTGPVLVATIGTATSYTVTGLSSRKSYSFYVTAVHAGGQESFASNAASVTTK
jgi:probable HAF family extracellular repeat protein